MTDAVVAAATARPVRRVLRRSAVAVGSILMLCVVCTGGLAISLLGGLTEPAPQTNTVGCGNNQLIDLAAALPRVSTLTADQVHNAAVIIKVAQDLKVPPRGWVIGIATALQESRLTNLPHLGARNDHDSIGLFQQRPSAGWGTPAQLADPAYQARRFFEKLLRIPNWQHLPLTVAAQRVQISAYPNAYSKHEPLASRTVDALTGGASRAIGTEIVARCTLDGEITASGWTVPVRGGLTSGFRTSARPTHNGVDIGVPKGTQVHAATAGRVIVAICNAHIGLTPFSCDRDGGLFVTGCGWYVDILHANKTITRYCHMMVRPYVRVGQMVAPGDVIGLSGSSGNSTGPHLHFEIHLNGDGSGRGAVDPVPYMNQVGASLVKAL